MMDPDYDLFAAIVEAQSLSAAARRLGLSPASISKRLNRLEERLGARLIHRTTRRMALTPQGHRLHQDLVAIRAALKAAEDRITGRADLPAGPLRVTAPTSFGRLHVAPFLGAFLDRYPRIALELDLSDSFIDLMASRYDLAIRITAQVGAGLVGHRLATSRRLLCAAPAYLERHGTPETLAALAGHRLLAAEGQLPWQLDGPEGSVVHAGRSAVRTNSSEVVRELALGGAGIALRSLWDVGSALAGGALVRVLPDYEGSHDVAIFIVHTPMPRLPAPAQALVDFLTARYQPVAPWEGLEGGA
jgi:DNA-binding transcriptional LysR family regulator